MISQERQNFFKSLKIHQIRGKGTIGFGQVVNLTSSDNDYIKYPCKGVLDIIEQGMDLSIIVAVFHQMKDDGSLGPPQRVGKVKFNNEV
jgi:hypothetical protein